MGAKTWMLVYANGDPRAALRSEPALDVDASLGLARSLFPREELARIEDGDLSYTCPPDDGLEPSRDDGGAVTRPGHSA